MIIVATCLPDRQGFPVCRQAGMWQLKNNYKHMKAILLILFMGVCSHPIFGEKTESEVLQIPHYAFT